MSGSDTSSGSHPPLWRNRNFLSLFAGLFVTNAGDSLYSVATMWLVFELSNSTFLTGVANSLLLLPFLVQIVAGPIVDRFPVQRVLLVSQAVQGAVVLVLPLAASTGHLSTGLILVTVPVLSVMTVVTDPARASIVPRIVADHQLSRGNSALATVSLGLDMVFDALGGAFVGSVIAPRLKTLPLGQLTAVSFTVGSLLWLGSVLVSSTLLTVVLFGLAWIGAGANGVLVSTVNQRVFPTDVLGRVTAIKGTAASATLPVGSLVGGTVAVIVGPSTTVALAAGGFGFVGLYHALRTPLRRLPATSDISAADFGLELESEDTE